MRKRRKRRKRRRGRADKAETDLRVAGYARCKA